MRYLKFVWILWARKASFTHDHLFQCKIFVNVSSRCPFYLYLSGFIRWYLCLKRIYFFTIIITSVWFLLMSYSPPHLDCIDLRLFRFALDSELHGFNFNLAIWNNPSVVVDTTKEGSNWYIEVWSRWHQITSRTKRNYFRIFTNLKRSWNRLNPPINSWNFRLEGRVSAIDLSLSWMQIVVMQKKSLIVWETNLKL